jgi:hypothetical protein
MKFSVPLKACLLLVFSVFSLNLFSQSLNGGSITTASICTSYGSPASNLTNVTSPSGGSAPYTYQWEAKISLSGWTNIVNVGNELDLSPGILSYTTTYRRKTTDATGLVSYSNEITLFLTSNFEAGRIYFLGESTLSLTEEIPLISSNPASAGSGSYTYSWEVSPNSSNGPWSVISGETGLTYQPGPFSSTGVWYFRKKANDLNCRTSVYSDPIKLEILNPLPFTATYWTSRYTCVFPNNTPSRLDGRPARGGQTPYTYQWEKKEENATTWDVIVGATGVNYQPPTSISVSTRYRRKATDANGTSGYSNDDLIALVTTFPNPGIISTNGTQIAPNAPLTAAINIQSASNFYNGYYVWQSSSNGGSAWSDIPNYSYSTYFPEAAPTVTTCYRRSIREACATSERDTWTNSICIAPALPLTDGTISYGSGNAGCVSASTSPGIITGTAATGGSTPYTYKWQNFDGVDWIDITSTNTISYTPGILNHDAKFRRIVTDANGTSLTSIEVSITIKSNTNLKGGLIDGPIVTCANTAPGIINNIIDACGGGGVFTYTWELSTNGGSWTSISGADQPTYNATAIAGDTKFRRKVGDGCGSAVYSNEVPVYVYPSIEAGSIAPAAQTVCANQAPEFLGLTQNCHYTNGNVTYQWQRATSATGSWTNIAGATQPVYVPKASTVSYYYRLVVKSSVCNAEAISNVSSILINATCVSSVLGKTVTSNLLESNLSGKGNMKLYPNPVSKGQTVFITLGEDGLNCKAILRSTDGRAYNCTLEAVGKGLLQVKMPSNIAQGTYLIQISNTQKQWTERIVIF